MGYFSARFACYNTFQANVIFPSFAALLLPCVDIGWMTMIPLCQSSYFSAIKWDHDQMGRVTNHRTGRKAVVPRRLFVRSCGLPALFVPSFSRSTFSALRLNEASVITYLLAGCAIRTAYLESNSEHPTQVGAELTGLIFIGRYYVLRYRRRIGGGVLQSGNP